MCGGLRHALDKLRIFIGMHTSFWLDTPQLSMDTLPKAETLPYSLANLKWPM